MSISNGPRPSVAPTWFGLPRPNPGATLRLFCFPYAGGGTNIFSRWASLLPDTVELCLVHLPGREARLREKPFDRMSQLVEALDRAFLPYLDKPMAFFGHSLGGLVIFELSRHLRRQYGVQPAHLFISGCRPHSIHLPPSVHGLSPVQLLNETKRLEGLTGTESARDQLLQLMIPALRADLARFETYCYSPEEPLNCSITVFGGLDDCHVKYEYLEVWRNETTGPFALHLFRGDHFFIHTVEADLLKSLSKELRSLTLKEG